MAGLATIAAIQFEKTVANNRVCALSQKALPNQVQQRLCNSFQSPLCASALIGFDLVPNEILPDDNTLAPVFNQGFVLAGCQPGKLPYLDLIVGNTASLSFV